MLARLLRISLWEWKQQWRQWSFVLSLWLPLLVGAAIVWGIPREDQSRASAIVAVWDGTGQWLRRLQHLLAESGHGMLYPLMPEDTVALSRLLERVRTGEWRALLWLQPETAGISVQLWARTSSAAGIRELLQRLEGEFRGAVLWHRALPEGQTVVFREHWIVSELSRERLLRQTIAVLGMLVLGTAFVWSARIATEEHLSRVAEFLLSIVSAWELVLGKFLSVVVQGILQLLLLGLLGWTAARMPLPEVLIPGVLGYAFLVSLGLALAVWARNEAQLHGMVTLVLFLLFAGTVLASWGGQGGILLLTVLPLWVPVAAFWTEGEASRWMLAGELLTVAMTAGLLRRAAHGLQMLGAFGER
ncbi:hypothetical protein HRbin21_00292 [bacterium HR21]|nr:hypothetical protein HRbin21_00292 [bacterium HR21]